MAFHGLSLPQKMALVTAVRGEYAGAFYYSLRSII
jgi:hypothetical protein